MRIYDGITHALDDFTAIVRTSIAFGADDELEGAPPWGYLDPSVRFDDEVE